MLCFEGNFIHIDVDISSVSFKVMCSLIFMAQSEYKKLYLTIDKQRTSKLDTFVLVIPALSAVYCDDEGHIVLVELSHENCYEMAVVFSNPV